MGLLLGHQGSGATYPNIKDEVERSHLREHGRLPHTPETCQVYLRTVEEIDEHHVANVADGRMEGSRRAVAARGKLHKSIISSPVFPIASLGNVVPPVLYITLEIVLKLFKMLLERVKSQECTSNELGTQANEDEWKAKSRELLEWEGEYKIVCEKSLDLLNIRERYSAENEGDC